MRVLNREKRRRRKQATNRAITLTVEALEPRLALAAVGFGFEGTREQLDFHLRDHGHPDAYASAFAEQVHDARGNERFAFSNRSEFNLPMPGRDGHARGGPTHDRLTEGFFNFFGSAEGEAPAATRGFVNRSSPEPVDNIFEPSLRTETSLPRTTVVYVFVAPTSSPTQGADLPNFGEPATRFTPPSSTFSTDSVRLQSSIAATLPVAVTAASRTPPTTPNSASPVIRVDAGSSSSDAVSVQQASGSTRVGAPSIETFVSLASDDSASRWHVDDKSFNAAFKAFEPLARPVGEAAAEPEIVSSKDPMHDRLVQFPENSLWAGIGEGGFIEVDTDTADNSRERFEFAEDFGDAASFKRLSSQTRRDAFWFNFGTARLELLHDSPAVQDLAEEQAARDATGADEQAWLLDDGGVIVLASPQFIDQADEVAAIDDTGESSSPSATAASEIDIPMDAGLGVFQAIEVSACLVEQQDAVQATEGTTMPIECQATAGTDDGLPPAERAAQHSDNEPSAPIRAASMPLLLAFSAFLFRDFQNRKKVADRQRKA